MQAQEYKQNVILAASPMELIIMLYDAAITSLTGALTAFEVEEPDSIQQISNSLIHAQDIITELAVSLDMEKGGEIAHNLHRLYDFMLDHLAKANSTKDKALITEVRGLMQELRESWKEVAEQEPRRTTPPSGRQTGNIVIAG